MLKNVNKPLAQILLDEIGAQNGLRLTLADVVFGTPAIYSGPEENVDTQISFDIPAALVVRHWIKYKRWDLTELVLPHQLYVQLEGAPGPYPVSQILQGINQQLGMQLALGTDVVFNNQSSVTLQQGVNTVTFQAVADCLMLTGAESVTVQLSAPEL